MTKTPVPATLLQAVLWRRLDDPSFEHLRLMESSGGYILDGRVLTTADGTPAEAHYTVRCAADWTTREAHVQIIQGTSTRRVRLRRDESSQWWRDDERVPHLDGIPDVDLAVSPSTNTLAIRRMALDIGESRPCDAAWVSFPELTLERLSQRYTRLDDVRYRYENDDGAFVTEIQVDDQGVVVRYGNIWERIAVDLRDAAGSSLRTS